MRQPQIHMDVVECPRDIRIIASIAGRYALADRHDARGARREFACRAINISPRDMTLAAPVIGAIGERVITHFDAFGKLEGSIIRPLDRGFVMDIAATDEERTKLAAKIEWFEKNKNHDVPDLRQEKRIVPQNPHSTLVFADGRTLGCFVIDMSVSGVAVSADINPEIGTPLAVGKVVGRVVRLLADGFAVQFINLQDPGTLERLVISQ